MGRAQTGWAESDGYQIDVKNSNVFSFAVSFSKPLTLTYSTLHANKNIELAKNLIVKVNLDQIV
jgi:hypothetical protein